jgi:glycolate oxidase FAD binding subunit
MTLAPRSLDELQEAVASSAPAPLRIRGGGTKREPGGEAVTLDLRQLSGVVAYNAAECVITALGGTTVREIQRLLGEHGQYLPFDPPLAQSGATIGGTVAAGLSGSGRYRYGGIRDFIIGAAVVDGEGRLVRSGGQVVKNAAGFLLHHALVGSAGRYGAIGEVSFKVFPTPEARATVQAARRTAREALDAHERVRLAIHDLDALDVDLTAQTAWVRLAGPASSLPARIARVREALGGGEAALVEGADDARLWDHAAEFAWAGAGTPLVKLVGAPSLLRDAPISSLGAARSTCGGAAVLLSPSVPLDAVGPAIGDGWRGVVVRGRECGRPLAPARGETFRDGARLFDERVRRVLDPAARFV